MTTLFGMRQKRKRALLITEIALLTAGFLCLAWAGYMTGQSTLSNSWQTYQFDNSLAGNKADLLGYVRYLWAGGERAATPHGRGEQPAVEEPKRAAKTVRKYRKNELIGRIEIPRLKVSAVVKEGVDTKTLSGAVGHVPYTPGPGDDGNVGVAAHRDTYFRGLRNVRHGDVIRMTTTDGVYLYEVDSLKIVWPRNVEVLDPTPDKRITLVTCYPFNYIGSAPKRFIVQGKQVGFEELTAGGTTRSEVPSDRSVRAGT